MENIKVRKKQTNREKEDTEESRESRYEEMLESYTLVPPSPHVLKKKRKKKRSL